LSSNSESRLILVIRRSTLFCLQS